MNFLTDNEMKALLQALPADAVEAGKFFEDSRYVPGRIFDSQSKKVIQPHESIKRYEELLSQIKRVDPKKYASMHKGTPFYIMGWLAYEMGDYEKGLFYMDAALSEDVNNAGADWKNLPAASFLFLNEGNTNAAAYTITLVAKQEVVSQVERFSKTSGENLDVNILLKNFFEPHAKDSAYRSIITSILTFLLEGKDLRLDLSLRSAYGGTSEPFLTHLFKGGLIFESLLKRKYYSHGHTLGKYLTGAKTDLQLNHEVYKRRTPYQFQEFPTLMKKWGKENFQERAVSIAFAVRNTAGHDLAWQDIFTDELYLKLFQGIVDAIFWTIKKCY